MEVLGSIRKEKKSRAGTDLFAGKLGGQQIVRSDVSGFLDERALREQSAVETNVGSPAAGGLAECENVQKR